MADGGESDESERITKVREIVGSDELVESIKKGVNALKESGRAQETVDGPDDETRYILYRNRLPADRYHELARTTTEAVLKVSPRAVTGVEVQGIDAFLRNRDEVAVETLLDGGVSYVESEYNDGTIEGRCTATPDVVEAVLSLYMPGLNHAQYFTKPVS